MDVPKYVMCTGFRCWHFVEPNPATDYDIRKFGLAPYLHLDDGEKEHTHDASPSDRYLTLDEWRSIYPELFEAYPDGKIGPNSKHFVGRFG